MQVRREAISNRFLVYDEGTYGANPKARPIGAFSTYKEAEAFGKTKNFPVRIILNWKEGKPKRDCPKDIEFNTNKGKHITLKWVKNEYRAFDDKGTDLHLGATIPTGLIDYIKEKM